MTRYITINLHSVSMARLLYCLAKLIKFVIFMFIMLLNLKVSAQNNNSPVISTIGGQQKFCLKENTFELSVQIDQNGYEGVINFYEIIWGDGLKKDTIPFSPGTITVKHTYDFEDFFKTCEVSKEFTVRLNSYIPVSTTPLNSAFFPIFINPPIASFEFSQNIVCVGDEACFRSTSCPTDGLEIVSWDYGDNSSPNAEGCYTYTQKGSYPVTLTVKNGCDQATITQTITVIEPPQAEARPIAGIVGGTNDPFLVCLSDGNPVILDASDSENVNSYEWTPRSQNGISWLSNRLNARDTLRFTRAGDYAITLTVNNACNKPDSKVLNFRVVDAVALTLAPQPDACEMLNYTPSPFVPEATYRINGEEVSSFPRMLPPGVYTLEATLSNECGPQTRQDDFEVRALQTINILNADTTLCSGDLPLPIVLSDSIGFGNCLVNDVPLPDCVFDPSSVTGTDFTIRYGGECLTSNEVKIKVIQTANLRINVPKVTFCIEDAPVTIVASDAGGRFSGRGFADSLLGIYDPRLAGIGKDTIRYELAFEASGNELCPAAATAIVETFPALMVDFTTTDCSGNTVTFDTINTSNRFSNIRYDFGDGRSATTARASHTFSRAGTYDVTITLSQNGGCSATQRRQVTVEPPPVALFSLSHDNIPCSPLLVNIADRSTGNNRKYFWDFGNGQTDTVSNLQPITYEAIGRDTTYIITLRVSNGCNTVTYKESVFVKAGPNPRFDLDKDLHCSGESVAFQRINANADDNNNYWFWEFGDGRTFLGKNAPPIVYETNRQDTLMVSLTVGNECDTTTFRRAVVVIPTDVTAFLNVDRTITCSGSEVRFINASGVPNAEFFFSDGTSLKGDTIFHEFISSKDTVFRATMRVFGCGYGDTTLMIRVLPMPTLTASIPDVACSGDNVPIIVNTDVADVQVMYGDGDSTQLRSSRHVYTTSGYFFIEAIAISASGCVSETVDSIFIEQSPVANFDIPPLLCEKNSATFTDASSASVTNWEWKFGDGNITSGNPIVNNNYANTGQFLVTLAVESANGCKDTIIQPIEIQPLPRLNVNYSIPDPCLLNVAFRNETSANAFQWRFGDGSANSTQTNPLHTYPSSDTYSATLIANLDGCLDSISIEVTLPDIPSFEASFEQSNLCAPSSVDFSVFNVANVDLWELQFGDGFNSFEPSDSHTYFVPDTYFATIQAKGGDCVIDTTFEILVGDTLLAKVQRSQNIACFGAATGSIEINVNSGNSPYSFDWSNGLNINPAIELFAGTYQVTITDRLGCELVLEEALRQPQEALTSIKILVQHTSCYEASDGAIEIAAVGGTSPYKYLWNTNSRNRSLDNLVAGDYTVSIEDANGCILEKTTAILQPDPIQIAFEVEPVCYDSTGSFTVFVDGGTPPFLISLSQDFDNLGDFYDDLLPGRYTIYVEDSNGCQEDAVVEIEELPDWILRNSPAEADLLKGDSIFLNPFISINQATFEWQPIDSVKNKDKKDTWTIPLLDTTLFKLKATDQFGCVKYATSKINVKDTFAIFIPNAFTPGSSDRGEDGINDYFIAYSKFPAVKMIKQMVIANKLGQIVFSKDNILLKKGEEDQGWDGTFQGEPQVQDEYKYVIIFQLIDGEITRSGKVLLIR